MDSKWTKTGAGGDDGLASRRWSRAWSHGGGRRSRRLWQVLLGSARRDAGAVGSRQPRVCQGGSPQPVRGSVRYRLRGLLSGMPVRPRLEARAARESPTRVVPRNRVSRRAGGYIVNIRPGCRVSRRAPQHGQGASMRSRRVFVAFLILAIAVSGPNVIPAADPPSPEQSGDVTPTRVSYLYGEVSFWRPGAQEWAEAKANTPLAPGDVLYTGADGSAELQIGPRAFVRAGNRSEERR